MFNVGQKSITGKLSAVQWNLVDPALNGPLKSGRIGLTVNKQLLGQNSWIRPQLTTRRLARAVFVEGQPDQTGSNAARMWKTENFTAWLVLLTLFYRTVRKYVVAHFSRGIFIHEIYKIKIVFSRQYNPLGCPPDAWPDSICKEKMDLFVLPFALFAAPGSTVFLSVGSERQMEQK